MDIGLYDINESSDLDYKTRINIYKSMGFTSVGVYLDNNYMSNNENYVDIIKYAKQIGLKVNQVHVDYKISNMICDDSSNKYFDYIEEKIKECEVLEIPYMVLHASKGEDAPTLTEVGINKLKKLMANYKEVFLCFENVRDNKNLNKILNSNINNVGMCYDLGHAYCYDDPESLLEKYKDNIICTHLHNNHKKDTHNTLFDGDIDCRKIIKVLCANKNIDNCLEVFPPRGEKLDYQEFIGFVKKCYKEYQSCID